MSETPCGRPHRTAEPSIDADAARRDPPTECEDGDVRGLWLKDARVVDLDLDRPEWLDLIVEDCDVSGVVATGFAIRRAEIHRSRIRGVTLANGQVDDVLVEGCPTDGLSFRFSRLRHVVFRDCDLSGTDFYRTTFEHVTIVDSNLQRADFGAADVKCLSLQNCDLAGVRGVAGLRGATLDADDLPALAFPLAAEVGIAVRDPGI
jgi:uncharacterized protein YjbI with pentapeptide repeats